MHDYKYNIRANDFSDGGDDVPAALGRYSLCIDTCRRDQNWTVMHQVTFFGTWSAKDTEPHEAEGKTPGGFEITRIYTM